MVKIKGKGNICLGDYDKVSEVNQETSEVPQSQHFLNPVLND